MTHVIKWSTFSSDHGKTEFRAGDCVSLSCEGAPSNCSSITWLFSYKNGTTDTLFEGGKFKSEGKKGRLHVTKECSLEVKLLRKREDVGLYICRSYPSAGLEFDHAAHQLKLMSEYLYSYVLTLINTFGLKLFHVNNMTCVVFQLLIFEYRVLWLSFENPVWLWH